VASGKPFEVRRAIDVGRPIPATQEMRHANLDRQQLIGALVLLVSALLVVSRVVKSPYQVWIKRASIAGFLLALGVVFVSIMAWLVSL
jgi:hypothetical protein